MSSGPAPEMKPGAVYRRLLSYARPHLGMWLIGVLGMVLFAATDTSFAFFVKRVHGAHAVSRVTAGTCC